MKKHLPISLSKSEKRLKPSTASALKIKNHAKAFLTLITPWVSIERITWCKTNIENNQ
jgi:hypothetical protein